MIFGITLGVVVVVGVASWLAERARAATVPARRAAPDSPLPGVSAAAWGEWLKANQQTEDERQAHPERTALYGLRPRELADVGLGVQVDEREALARVSRKLAGMLTQSHAAQLGEEIEGQPASLSGLMAVARYAGLGGLESWCADAGERTRFADTTRAYQRANGLF